MFPHLSDHLPTITFAAGMALATTILLRRAYRFFGRRPKRNTRSTPVVRSGRTSSAPSQPLADAPPSLQRWEVAMHETARELKAEIDSKMICLQQYIRLAAEERRRLEAVLDRAPVSGAETDAAPQPAPSQERAA